MVTDLKIMDFIHQNENWREILSAPPYNLHIKHNDGFILLKYNQIDSDFSNPLVNEARGLIFDLETLKPVCHSFNKFYNYGEENAAEIDWDSAVVLDKLDGSLIRVWWDKRGEQWRVSTSGTIDAKDAELGDGENFYDLFMSVSGFDKTGFPDWDKDLAYSFELLSLQNQVVIAYPESRIVHIGTRNMKTLEEVEMEIGIQKPKTYVFRDTRNAIEFAKNLPFDKEGYVLRDKNWARIKVKSPEYLRAHRLKSGITTNRNLIEIIRIGEQSELVSCLPQYKEKIDKFEGKIKKMVQYIEGVKVIWNWPKVMKDQSKKEFAEIVKCFKHTPFFFKMWNNPELKPEDWLWSLRNEQILRILEEVDE